MKHANPGPERTKGDGSYEKIRRTAAMQVFSGILIDLEFEIYLKLLYTLVASTLESLYQRMEKALLTSL